MRTLARLAFAAGLALTLASPLSSQQSWGAWTPGAAAFGDWHWGPPSADVASLPAGAASGSCRYVVASEAVYCYTGAAWVALAGGGGGAGDFSELTGQLGDLQTADGAIDGGTGGEIADATITAADLAPDSVAASELDAGAVEAELEAVLDLADLQGSLTLAGDVDGAHGSSDLDEAAVEVELEGVLDLSDLQGAVTDAQVPNGVTIDLATLATTATTANAGDSATAFFSSGTVEADRLPALSGLNGAVTDAQVPNTITVDLAATATALAANGSNCAAGQWAAGVDASGAAEGCTADATGTDSADDLTNNDLGDLANVVETGEGANVPLVGDGLGGWEPAAAAACLEDGTDCPAAGGTPGGADTQVQYNDGGAFGGDADLTFSEANNRLSVGRLTVADSADDNDPGISFGGGGMGFNRYAASDGAALHVVNNNGTKYQTFRYGSFAFANDGQINWTANASPAGTTWDTTLSRSSAAVVKFDDALRLDPRSSPPVTCGSANTQGVLYADSDSTELCYCDGSAWTGLKAGGACS